MRNEDSVLNLGKNQTGLGVFNAPHAEIMKLGFFFVE
jgi:hypothetical protein